MNSILGKKVIVMSPKVMRSDLDKQIYKAWYDTWSDAIKNDLKLDMELYSDSFTRQDRIVAIYDCDKQKCIGLAFFKYVDFNNESAKHDSYFKEWPKRALRKLVSRGSKVAICSQFTICKEYRKERNPFKWKDILMFVITHNFIHHTNSDVMTGAVRVSRAVNTTSYALGALAIMKNIKNTDYNAYEDLVGFYRSEVKQSLEDEAWDQYRSIFEVLPMKKCA